MTYYEGQDGTTAPRVPPFIWPSVYELTKCVESKPVLADALGDAGTVLGIMGGLAGDGIAGLNSFFERHPSVRGILIVAVYAACPTRRNDLMRLLELQRRSGNDIEIRVLLMTEFGGGLPANCLVGIPHCGTSPVFVFGPTVNFNWVNVDPSQVNLAFRAPPVMFDEWRKWFDATWHEATPLTEEIADIPELVPATGSPEASAMWEDYRALCANLERKQRVIVDEDGEVCDTENADGSEDRTPTRTLELPKLDRLAQKVSLLFDTGRQVTVNQASAVRPLDLPIRPSLLDSTPVYRDGAITQRQSFRVSVFSPEELKILETSRKGSQFVLRKLGLPLEKGIYWVPDEIVPILEKEIQAKNEAAKQKLRNIVGGNAKSFVEGKREKLRKDLSAVYKRLHNNDEVSLHVLTELIDEVTARIELALQRQFVTSVTLTRLEMDFTETRGWVTPWIQAEKLVLALCRFARQAICRPKLLAGLVTARSDIARAMDVADDHIRTLVSSSPWIDAERVARSELHTVKQIEDADLAARDRCQAGFMLIEGEPPDLIRDFIAGKEALRRRNEA